ncbi:MAG: enoyl-CoA hydratase/isomerase family protein [Hyphomonadaceae bacterium]
MPYESICYEVSDDVAVITLNRPDKLNAWTPAMGAEMIAAFEAANADPAAGAIILTGAGRAFCAGADVEATLQSQADKQGEGLDFSSTWIKTVRASKPCVAAINGAAVGMGVTMTLAFDTIVAAAGAKIALGFIRMGLSPELGGSRLLAQRVGFGRASELCLSGRQILAEEAAQIGLVEYVAQPEDLLGKARAIAQSFAANPAPQARLVKQLLSRHVLDEDLDAVVNEEIRVLDLCRASPEHAEAIAAFLEKRAPRFVRG